MVVVLDRVAYHTSNVSSPVLLSLFDEFIKSLAAAKSADDIGNVTVNPHDVKEFLSALRARNDVSREDVARREFAALPILGWMNMSGLTLHRFMAEDPEFFVHLISLAYRPEGKTVQEEEYNATSEQQASSAFRLLETAAYIPGSRPQGQIESEELLSWIEKVRELARESGRLDIADQKIGQVLAHAPSDPADDAWPHRAIRTAVQKIGSNDLGTGLRVGRHNLRGTVSKEIFEGGGQERELAAQYRKWAQASAAWPRVARVLSVIADSYGSEAGAEDARAEHDKLDI